MPIDISYCSNLNCKNKKCFRNQKNVPDYLLFISISNFPDCKYWEDTNGIKRSHK